MKIRRGFVSNSSSSSFILEKKFMTQDQINSIMSYEGGDYWSITENDETIHGFTCMDNGYMQDYFKTINLSCRAIHEFNND